MSDTNPYNKLVLPALEGNAILSFSTDNAKLKGSRTAVFSLPAGYSCPGASKCLSWFDREENKLKDGPDAEFRCFAASMEAGFSSVRKSVDKNYAILKEAGTTTRMADVIDLSLPGRYWENIRIHADGDFFNQSYFLAWAEVARRNPERLFYAYTKSLPFWVKFKKCVPENLVLTASRGGKWDHLISLHNLRCAHVAFHPDEADILGLEIDHDDSHARASDGRDFALLIHGQQKSGSEGAKALKRLRVEGVKYAYSRK